MHNETIKDLHSSTPRYALALRWTKQFGHIAGLPFAASPRPVPKRHWTGGRGSGNGSASSAISSTLLVDHSALSSGRLFGIPARRGYLSGVAETFFTTTK